MRTKCTLVVWLLLAAAQAGAQGASTRDWLDSPPAQVFRERVIALALLYGDSSGIDPQGFKVATKQVGERVDGCALVEVVTSLGQDVQRKETVRACAAHP
jgi:hypothetical protein